MGVSQPDLTGDGTGTKGGVPGGTATVTQTTAAVTSPNAPQKQVQTTWRPESFVDFHHRLRTNPDQLSRALDQAIRQAHNGLAMLNSMIACRQSGSAKVTGSVKNIPTGLSSVRQVQASIDNGATAHNFWVSAVISQTPGAVDLYVWQPTAANNTTPIAATTAVTVRWIADGSL